MDILLCWQLVAAGLSWRPSRQWSTWVGMTTSGCSGKPGGQTHTGHCHGKSKQQGELNNSQGSCTSKVTTEIPSGFKICHSEGDWHHPTAKLWPPWRPTECTRWARLTLKCTKQSWGLRTQDGGSCFFILRSSIHTDPKQHPFTSQNIQFCTYLCSGFVCNKNPDPKKDEDH